MKPAAAPPVDEPGGSSIVFMSINRIGIVGTGSADLRAVAEFREAGFTESFVA